MWQSLRSAKRGSLETRVPPLRTRSTHSREAHYLRFRTTIALTLVSFSLLGVTSAQVSLPSVEWTSDAPLNDVCFVSPEIGCAVGERGLILRTSDGGRTWERSRSPVTCNLDAVHFTDAQQGWVVGGYCQPITHLSTGVVLRTANGGRTWTRIDNGSAPWMLQIEMLNGSSGWARCHRSPLCPSGLLQTHDGGKTWTSLKGEGSGEWKTAVRADNGTIAVAGREKAASLFRHGKLEEAFVTTLGKFDVTAAELVDNRHGWGVGSAGQVLMTRDGGFSWNAPPVPLDPQKTQHFDWNTVAAAGNHVWIAGHPGTRIATSFDQGQSWQWISTGNQAPIRKLFFLDEKNGWAVGDLGVILATNDGGKTWRTLRASSPRVAYWGVFESADQVPLELFAKYSGNDGYMSSVSIAAPAELSNRNRAPQADRMRQSFSNVGVSGWREGVPRFDDEATPEAKRSALLRWLVREIRTWQPIVIVSDISAAEGRSKSYAATSTSTATDPNYQLDYKLLTEALAAASDPQQFPEQLAATGLSAWSPQKLYWQTDEEGHADETVETLQFAPRLGTSIDDYCLSSKLLLRSTIPHAAKSLRWQLAEASHISGSSFRSFFAGLPPMELDKVRRVDQFVPPSNLEVMRRLARKEEWIERVLQTTEASHGDAKIWEREVERLVIGLGQDSIGNVLFQLAMQHEDRGQFESAARALHRVLTDCPDHPLRDGSLMWLVRYYASTEAKRRVDADAQTPQIVYREANPNPEAELLNELELKQPNDSAGGRMLMVDDPIQVPFSARQMIEDNRFQDIDATRREIHAQQLLQAMRVKAPLVMSLPSVELSASVLQMKQSGTSTAPAQLIPALKTGGNGWAVAAEIEDWLRNQREAPPVPILLCQTAETPPQLDGKLDDQTWLASAPVGLRWLNAHSASRQEFSTMRVVKDREFIYFAFELPLSDESKRTASKRTPRERDANMDETSRLWISLDVDRDYVTSYTFEIDERGRLRDASLGRKEWNPQWFVAESQVDNKRIVEIAVPLSQLVYSFPRPQETWAIQVRRLEEGESAPRTMSFFSPPQPESLLMFVD